MSENKIDTLFRNEIGVKTEETNSNYEMVEHPPHYNKYDVEVIEMMRRIWGDEEVRIWCKLTAFKYRMRLGEKPKNPIEQDLKKEKYYLDYAKELKDNTNPKVGDKVLLRD
jgi:hypothetical protein